ncbi:hypothetical protein FHU33_1514 [Blastococcus colisei]|uniref:Uncharacterized protein n=1 Tax=Blastococcus colisei TaxID=1564162 RepID=A0A543PDJ0_9ACTN|nr:hypothetical protein [Blastococcus colisei]TQN42120.1 hypothetical protein FHU33_1514 [Blastococcus colisei]
MSEPSQLQLPEWLSTNLRATPAAEVAGQPVTVNRSWWEERLDGTPFADELFDSPEERLTRTLLFELGERAGKSPEDARRLLWATLAWGTGRRHRNNRARVTAVVKGGDELSEVLRRAAEVGRADPSAAYRLLRPYRNAVSHLGPPFFTKFLYFAGGGSAAHPCLILDSLVAKTLRRQCGWTELTGWYSWPANQYVDYCELLARWAKELSDDVTGDAVRPDQLEYALFNRGRHS